MIIYYDYYDYCKVGIPLTRLELRGRQIGMHRSKQPPKTKCYPQNWGYHQPNWAIYQTTAVVINSSRDTESREVDKVWIFKHKQNRFISDSIPVFGV